MIELRCRYMSALLKYKKGGNMPNTSGLKPIRDSETARMMQAKGVEKQKESRKQNAKIKQILKAWADRNVSPKNLEVLKRAGIIDEDADEATNRALVSMQIIDKVRKGDLKALDLLLTMIGENERYEQEIKKLKEENKKLKLEQEKLKVETGVNKDIENLDTLADMLKDGNDANED